MSQGLRRGRSHRPSIGNIRKDLRERNLQLTRNAWTVDVGKSPNES
jgi:hypothetical protein